MSAPDSQSGKWTAGRVTLLIAALFVAIAGAVYLADRFSVRDRSGAPPTTVPASTASQPA